MEITAVIIDEERTFADALAIRLNAEEDLSVVAVTQPAATTMGWHADIILLDVDLTGSVRFCKTTSGPPNATRVIMLSHTSEPSRIVAAIEAGARAWVRKDESVEHLLRVLRGVARGETWLPPAETGNVLSLLLRQRDGRADTDRLLDAPHPPGTRGAGLPGRGGGPEPGSRAAEPQSQHGAYAPAEHHDQARRPFDARSGGADAWLASASRRAAHHGMTHCFYAG